MSTGLVLLGHGSHISPNTAAVVWEAVDALRALGIADEITAGFWKEQPAFSRVLHTLNATDITLLPMFTAQGYFTRQVIPAEMSLTNALRMTKTLGEHPYIAEIVQNRAQAALTQWRLSAESVALAVIGHGTKNNPTSRAATESQAEKLRALGLAREVVAVYLDDDPIIPTIYETTNAPVIVAIPYFLAAGSHATEDVPFALGLETGQTEGVIRGRQVIYTPPIGVNGGLTDILLGLISDSGAGLMSRPVQSVWDGMPLAGRDTFLEAVAQSKELAFGALTITADEVRCGIGDDLPRLTKPTEVRDAVRLNPFRPWVTMREMPNRWRVRLSRPEDAHAVVETVYPGAIAEWAAYRRGEFKPIPLADVVARQKGMFRALVDFSAESEAEYVEKICGGCVLTPYWARGEGQTGALPCAEPCNVYLSAAKGGLES